MGTKQWQAMINLAVENANRYGIKQHVFYVHGIGWVCATLPKAIFMRYGGHATITEVPNAL